MKTTKSNSKQSREYLRQHPTYTAAEIENFGYSKERAAEIAADPSKNWKAANGGQRKEKPTLASVKPVCSDLTDPGDWLNPEAVKLVGKRIAELEKQQAELLASLEWVTAQLTHHDPTNPSLRAARAAIAAAPEMLSALETCESMMSAVAVGHQPPAGFDNALDEARAAIAAARQN